MDLMKQRGRPPKEREGSDEIDPVQMPGKRGRTKNSSKYGIMKKDSDDDEAEY